MDLLTVLADTIFEVHYSINVRLAVVGNGYTLAGLMLY